MSTSNNIVNILNKSGIPTDNIIDIFVNWRKLYLIDCDVKINIKSERDKLIRYSDHEENEEIIDFLMELEINQDDHKYNQEILERRIISLENTIEYIVDNYEVDLRDFPLEEPTIPPGNFNKVITDKMWSDATLQRRREKRLGSILDHKTLKDIKDDSCM